MTKTSNKRGSRLVNLRVQGGLVLRCLLYWIGYHAALLHAMFVCRIMTHRLDVAGGAVSPLPLPELYVDFLRDQQFLLFCAAAAFPIVARDVIVWTHRVVGPLIRFQRVLEQLTRGEPVDSVRLRKGDLLVDLQKTFNDYLDVLNGRSPSPGDVADDAAAASKAAATTKGAEAALLADVSSLQGDVSKAAGAPQSHDRPKPAAAPHSGVSAP